MLLLAYFAVVMSLPSTQASVCRARCTSNYSRTMLHNLLFFA
jgi:hypothetical protein